MVQQTELEEVLKRITDILERMNKTINHHNTCIMDMYERIAMIERKLNMEE